MESKAIGKVDIVCGGQFGDEGKGAVAAYLASRKGQNNQGYSFTARVGGYNAEHRYYHAGKEYTGRVLPCGLIEDSLDLYLGAGHLFSIDALNHEVESMSIRKERVVIDRNAGIVTEKHMGLSAGADRGKRGGTTGRGAGKAATDKVLRDGSFKVAGEYPELAENYRVDNVSMLIRSRLNNGEFGLLEGSQGALLSVDHGYYPFNCAKNVTPTGVLAETGVESYAVRDTYVVYRAFPMRVPGTSGPSKGRELPWEEIETMLGRPLTEDQKRQTLADGTKGDYERMFEWNDEEFLASLTLCGPTQMVLTFADWLNPEDSGVTEFEKLSQKTKDFVAHMETLAEGVLGRKVPVSIIKTGAAEESVINRIK